MTSTGSDPIAWDEINLAEDPAADLLEAIGYEFVSPEVLEAERGSLSETILVQRLQAALKRLNPWINESNLQNAVQQLTHVAALSAMEANERLHTALVYNISLPQDLGHGMQGQTVRYIDFERPQRNEFIFTRQYRVQGAKKSIVPDIVVFVNGIPLGVIECKSPTIQSPVEKGIEQLTRYQELTGAFHQQGAPRLFHTAQVLVSTCGEAAKYSSTGTPARFWGYWKVPFPLTLDQLQAQIGRIPRAQEVLLYGLFRKESLLDLMANFIVFEVEGSRTHKKLARYQQFIAVNRAIDRARKGKTPLARGGVVWHTQGSGKSLTMVYLAVKLRRLAEFQNPMMVVVTDRRDLDRQISATFKRCGFPNPEQAGSVAHLRELLAKGNGHTVMTTVQKFQESSTDLHPVLNDASNVFVMVDEAHRTQYKNLAANMRRALPNACFLGFTGTPIDRKDKSTFQTFGSYIHTYSIEQAVQDEATVAIFYEMRQSLERVEGETIDAVFDRVFRDRTMEEREAIKAKFATAEAIAGAPRRIERICMDLIEHFETHIRPNGFKAQIVACSREAAVTYKEQLDRLEGPLSAVIMSSTHNDTADLAKWKTSREEQRQLIDRFKDPVDPLCILIVCDMLLTGFDAPIEQVMYLDSPLREHSLLQAIARVNRTADNKDFGLVVDYWGIAAHLEEALAIFTRDEVQGAMRPLTAELPTLETRHRRVMRFFQRIDRSSLESCLKVLEPEDVRAEFELAFRRFSQSLDMLLPDPLALPFVEDAKWLGKLRHAARARFRDDRFDFTGCRAKVRQLIEEHLRSSEVEVLVKPVSIMAPEFEDEVAKLTSDEARASEMEHAIRHEITARGGENPVLFEALSKRLNDIIERRKQERLTLAEQLNLLSGMVLDIRSVKNRAEELGLSEAGFAVYEVILSAAGDGDVSDEGLKNPGKRDTAASIIRDVGELAVVDWVLKEDVQRRMRMAIKQRLRTAGFDKNVIEPMTAKIMDVARVQLRGK